MAALIMDPLLQEKTIGERRRLGLDLYDEVWEGVYVMPPMPTDEHQELVSSFTGILMDVVGWTKLGEVRSGVNLSDREVDWTKNYRIPDVAVFLKDTKAKNCNTHWVGPADFLIEITSPYDQTRDKLPFYEKLGVREVLLIDRDPWQMELYRYQDNQLALVGRSAPEEAAILTSTILPLTFQLKAGDARPEIIVNRTDETKGWTI